MAVPASTDVAARPQQLHLLQSQLTRTQHYLSSKLSFSPLLRVSLRRVSFLFAFVSPVAAAIDGHIDQLVHCCYPSHAPTVGKQSHHADEAAAATDKQQDGDVESRVSSALPSSAAGSTDPGGQQMLVGAVWERHITDELSLSDITPDQCLQAFYNASCHCFLALSDTPSAASASPSRSALTFVSRLRSSLRSAWHADLLPAALSFHQLASRHLQHHSLLFPPPSPFPFFLSDSFREHFFALHAAAVRSVYQQQMSAVGPTVYRSLERICASPSSSTSLHALHEHLSASPSLSPLIPHLSHARHRIHHHHTTQHFATTHTSTALVPFTADATGHLTLSAALWSAVDTALVRWRHAVQRGCVALHECIRVMEEESARREMRDHEDEFLELEHDDMLLITHDESEDEDHCEDKQLMLVPNTTLSNTSIGTAHPPSKTTLAQQLHNQILSSLKQLTAVPLPHAHSKPPPDRPPPSPIPQPALHYHLTHLYSTLTTLHTHLLHYLLSHTPLHYPADLLAALRDGALCVAGCERERLGELEYGGLVGKVYEVVRALYETIVAVQSVD